MQGKAYQLDFHCLVAVYDTEQLPKNVTDTQNSNTLIHTLFNSVASVTHAM